MIFSRFKLLSFSIRISESESDIFRVNNYRKIFEIKSKCELFDFYPKFVNADPFLFVNDDWLYLFYEECMLGHKGVIKMTRTRNLIEWDKPKIVLEDSFHLSYPNVFMYDGDIYMMPETSENKSISLYKPCSSDLQSWSRYRDILVGENFVDSSIITINNVCYLFTTVMKDGIYQLRLYYADSLLGNWIEHPKSPVYIGNDYGRCGGPVFEYNGNLYRPAQKCDLWYGEKLAIFCIQECSTTNYVEVVLYDNILPSNDTFFANGGHHISFTKFHKRTYVSMDGVNFKFNMHGLYDKVIRHMGFSKD